MAHLSRFQSPNGAGCVDGGGADEVGVHFVPVEGGEGGAEVAVFVVVEEAGHASLPLSIGVPHSEVVAAGR